MANPVFVPQQIATVSAKNVLFSGKLQAAVALKSSLQFGPAGVIHKTAQQTTMQIYRAFPSAADMLVATLTHPPEQRR
jgi:hypothetical protein